MKRLRVIAYWFCTLVLAWEMVAGSLWDLLQIEFVRSVFDQLHYPHYLLYIIGFWKFPCAVVVLLPRLGRLKEWAYAGAFFNYTGAAASHLLVGDSLAKWLGPAIFGLMTLASWALRPPERRLADMSPTENERVRDWLIPAGIVAACLILALLTLPKA